MYVPCGDYVCTLCNQFFFFSSEFGYFSKETCRWLLTKTGFFLAMSMYLALKLMLIKHIKNFSFVGDLKTKSSPRIAWCNQVGCGIWNICFATKLSWSSVLLICYGILCVRIVNMYFQHWEFRGRFFVQFFIQIRLVWNIKYMFCKRVKIMNYFLNMLQQTIGWGCWMYF